METPQKPRLLPIFELAILAIFVAICAGGLSGSCTFLTINGRGSTALAVLLAAGIALAISILFFRLASTRGEIGAFIVIVVSTYIAAVFGSWWWLLLWTVAVAFVVVVIGGIIAGFALVKSKRPGAVFARRVALASMLSTVSIALATAAVTIGFFSNNPVVFMYHATENLPRFNTIPFALIAGGVPPIVAAVTVQISRQISRPS